MQKEKADSHFLLILCLIDDKFHLHFQTPFLINARQTFFEQHENSLTVPWIDN